MILLFLLSLLISSATAEGELKCQKKRLIQSSRSSRLQVVIAFIQTLPSSSSLLLYWSILRRDDPKRYRNSQLPKYGAGRREQRGPGGLVKGMQGVPLTRKPGRYDQAVPMRWPLSLRAQKLPRQETLRHEDSTQLSRVRQMQLRVLDRPPSFRRRREQRLLQA